ncbi:fungal hydrophobin-domain-containing protein [Roridomyces roridus]|uniref:Fungal hydrophobin-domain-containing protein n=1 Tax=Roridomyces roridus TaxID=1738132 RepID=A0AAD7C185_9AGAR|nr:fungal hydrophobin-domain-containing protein [Roridomyces roridus]
MQFSLLTAAFFALAAMANPLEVRNNSPPAPAACANGALFSVAQCCTTIVLGVAALDCVTPPTGTNADNFVSNCIADAGREAGCCVAPVAGQALLCEPAALN